MKRLMFKIWWFFASEERRLYYSINVFGTAWSENGRVIDPHKIYKESGE